MIDFITTEMIKAVGIAVSEYAFGRVGDHLFDTFSTKLKIKGILRKDEKFIERQFKNQKIELLVAAKSFLFEEVFQDSIFYIQSLIFPRAGQHCYGKGIATIYRKTSMT